MEAGRVVVRIGGSVIASPVDVRLVEGYSRVLRRLWGRGYRLAVVVGGGELARNLIGLAGELGLPEEDRDQVAIEASRIVALLLSRKLRGLTGGLVAETLEEATGFFEEGRMVVMGGLKPGMTTDAVAVLLARAIGAKLIVKVSRVDGVYDRDPLVYSGARRLARVKLENLGLLLRYRKHKAGVRQVVDPQAYRLLLESPVELRVVSGLDPENLVRALEGAPVGTVVTP